MPHIRFQEIVGQHCVKQLPFYISIIPFKNRDIEFNILADLFNLLIFKNRLELFNYFKTVIVIFGQGYKPGFTRFNSKGNSNKFRIIGIKPCSFRIKTKGFCLLKLLNQFSSFFFRVSKIICMWCI